MKDPSDRTKVVLRHLPPALTQSALMEQIDGRFAARYNWITFRPGKTSHKHQIYSRAYIDFKKPDDVVEFAEFFDGHVFVNEKGAQFKAIVEYAPSQRVPKQWSKKDGRDGTILKDAEYLEFLELLAKPVENLPSAEIQLERREAERAGAVKEAPFVTPLMEFIRQKRAAKNGSQGPLSNGKPSRRSGGPSPSNSRSSSSKQRAEKKKASSMYVLRDSPKNTSVKEKPNYILVPRRDNQHRSDKSTSVENVPSTADGAPGTVVPLKKKVVLLKGKEREITHASGSGSQPLFVTSPLKTSPGASNFKQNQRRDSREASVRIRTILSNKDAHSEQQLQSLTYEKDKRPPRPNNMRSVLKDTLSGGSQAASGSDFDSRRVTDEKVILNDNHGFVSGNEKQEKRTRNKDRPDRGVWTLRRSEGSHASDESLSSSSSQLLSESVEGITITQHVPVHGITNPGDGVDIGFSNKLSSKPRNLEAAVDNFQGVNSSSAHDHPPNHGEMKVDMPSTSRSEVKTFGGGRSGYSTIENGSHRHSGRRGSAHAVKDVDGYPSPSDGKPSKRVVAANYGSHEKRVWVQKSGSGS
ncbi:regulator of nonsense transcripts UPF3-like [Papaver somniferum]|uniref:regulator of nonsense transcripts UPF3-like n=1 Tax=Papaver somniferum TaxID=3469 RepID=UPI000E6F84C2|nr:regulator of nonsense transcripts UPF3-like [Papaver somniferum]